MRVSAVRFWEQQGLLRPPRDRFSGYRLYDEQDLRKLQVVVILRQGGHRSDVIRSVLEEMAEGRPERARQAVERRREELICASWRCLEATATLLEYVRRWLPSLAPGEAGTATASAPAGPP